MIQIYEARLTTQESIERVRKAKREVEKVKGEMSIIQTKTAGVVIVLLKLPQGYSPDMFLPGLPFFPT